VIVLPKYRQLRNGFQKYYYLICAPINSGIKRRQSFLIFQIYLLLNYRFLPFIYIDFKMRLSKVINNPKKTPIVNEVVKANKGRLFTATLLT